MWCDILSYYYLTLEVTTGSNLVWLISAEKMSGQLSAQVQVNIFENYLFLYLATNTGNDGTFGKKM